MRAFGLLCSLCLLPLLACRMKETPDSAPQQEAAAEGSPLVGKWRNCGSRTPGHANSGIMDFRPDGTFAFLDTNSGTTFATRYLQGEGRWEVRGDSVDLEVLVMRQSTDGQAWKSVGPNEKSTGLMRRNGDSLVVTGRRGAPLRLVRR